MKKMILNFVFLFAIFSISFAQNLSNSTTEGVQFFDGTWQEALLLAQKENKPIFLDVYAVWCGPCKALKKNTFPDPDVGEYYNEHFINVTLDGEKGDGVNVAGELKVQAYPSLFILDSSGNPLVYYPGYLSPTEFLELGKVGIEKNKY